MAVVRSEGRPGQFLHQVVFLPGAAARGDEAQRVVAVSLLDPEEPPGGDGQRLVPTRRVQLAVVARFYERIGDHAVAVGDRTRFIVNGWVPDHYYAESGNEPPAITGDDRPVGGETAP